MVAPILRDLSPHDEDDSDEDGAAVHSADEDQQDSGSMGDDESSDSDESLSEAPAPALVIDDSLMDEMTRSVVPSPSLVSRVAREEGFLFVTDQNENSLSYLDLQTPSEHDSDDSGMILLIFEFWHQESKPNNQCRGYAVMGGEWCRVDATWCGKGAVRSWDGQGLCSHMV